jgi:hypothetical protein
MTHHIGAKEKPHHEVVPARRETEATRTVSAASQVALDPRTQGAKTERRNQRSLSCCDRWVGGWHGD